MDNKAREGETPLPWTNKIFLTISHSIFQNEGNQSQYGGDPLRRGKEFSDLAGVLGCRHDGAVNAYRETKLVIVEQGRAIYLRVPLLPSTLDVLLGKNSIFNSQFRAAAIFFKVEMDTLP
jgi:hypothetical protein